jgi:hypothetical protein
VHLLEYWRWKRETEASHPNFRCYQKFVFVTPTPRQSRIFTIYNLSPAQAIGKLSTRFFRQQK